MSETRKAPASIQVFVILLYIGGGLVVLSALTRVWSTPVYAAYGLLGLGYLLLARMVQLGRRWARTVMLALCGVGVALAVARLAMGGDLVSAVSTLAWPVVYAILLNTKASRAWFQPEPAA
ncbi:hypothetical protein [Phytohabitans rumicis]|uniref:Uncharacterized protein n=1 Tax=Phytohabitans rumicis TaxID=1076125 RepID=A0A6V8L5J3_9ACTN|nr:hypothetical protein [Phytohabitans rumicis]GFJ92522.1 hypothetical protein Prum_061640 [Phytohabitans rumicis]